MQYMHSPAVCLSRRKCSVWTQAPATDDQHMYTLFCPKCGTDLHDGLWFSLDALPDHHGYVSCSGCVNSMGRLTGNGIRTWHRLIRTDYRRWPKHTWDISMIRTINLIRDDMDGDANDDDGADNDSPSDDDDSTSDDDAAVTNEPDESLVQYLKQQVRAACANAGLNKSMCDNLLSHMDLTDLARFPMAITPVDETAALACANPRVVGTTTATPAVATATMNNRDQPATMQLTMTTCRQDAVPAPPPLVMAPTVPTAPANTNTTSVGPQ